MIFRSSETLGLETVTHVLDVRKSFQQNVDFYMCFDAVVFEKKEC